MVKTNDNISFDIEKLKQKNKKEIDKVAALYAKKELTAKQLTHIAFNARDAFDAIRLLANEISKSQETAFKANVYTNKNAYTHVERAQESNTTAEEKRDSYRAVENMHRVTTDANERMNSSNNSLWEKVTAGAVVIGAMVLYAVKNKDSK